MTRNLLFRLSLLLTCLLLFQNCSEDSDGNISGKIVGTVRDEISGVFLNKCRVSIAPSPQSMTTATDGRFEFVGLQAGKYEITFNRPGYKEKTLPHTVVVGLYKEMEVSLTSIEKFSISETLMDFGDFENSKSLYLTNNSTDNCTYSFKDVPEWVELSATEGKLAAGNAVLIHVTIRRETVPYGNYSGKLNLTFIGNESIKFFVDLKMQKVEKSVPTVTITKTPSKKDSHSITMKGEICSTGGSLITRHGHCWSISSNPTLDNEHSELGQREATGEFTSVLENLASNTTYYIRSYAANAQGVSYSQQIRATTDDASSDKWDGTKATKFDGGSGVIGDPYLITTGAQLNLVRDYPEAKFRLMKNINLGQHPWKPIYEFHGTFDGNDCTIYNVAIEQQGYHGTGFFGEVSGPTTIIKNLHLNGVYLANNKWSNVGGVIGKLIHHATLENCTLTLNENSKILGDTNTGGMVGFVDHGNIRNCKVKGCHENGICQILGDSQVGGIVGNVKDHRGSIDNCHVQGGVSGNTRIGGISGACGNITESSFTGYLLCEAQGGGICGEGGYGDGTQIIKSCKVNAEISGTDIGGILCSTNDGEGRTITSCYYIGKFNGRGTSGLIAGGPHNMYTSSLACFAIPEPGSSFKNSIGGKTIADCATTVDIIAESDTEVSHTIGNCVNILEHFRTISPQYQSDWNLENVWEKETMVNGKKSLVKFPRLFWEK